MDSQSNAKCVECPEHSGIQARQDNQSEIVRHLVTKFDRFVDDANAHRTQMLVGIILCLMAGLLSVYFSYESQHSKMIRGTYAWPSVKEVQPPLMDYTLYAIYTLPEEA